LKHLSINLQHARRLRTAMSALLFVSLFAGYGAFQADAQQSGTTRQEPDYANSFFYLEVSGGLKPLEREPLGMVGRAKAFGFGGADVNYQVLGERSPVRFSAGTPIQLVVKLQDRDVDPATLVVLYPLKVDKGKRQLLISSVGFLSMHNKSDMQSKQLQMVFTKYGQGSVRITPANPLPPGEYAIAVSGKDQQPTVYCFGIDTAQ
jgi:hypothetical protein